MENTRVACRPLVAGIVTLPLCCQRRWRLLCVAWKQVNKHRKAVACNRQCTVAIRLIACWRCRPRGSRGAYSAELPQPPLSRGHCDYQIGSTGRHTYYQSWDHFYRASVYWRAILISQICPSVCSSVRLLRSGIRWKRLNIIIVIVFSPYGSPIIVVLPASNIFTEFRRGHPVRGR